jgi:NTE family protein
VIDDKLLLLKRHTCSSGLSDEVLREITSACDLIRAEPGDYLHRVNQKAESVFLLIHGRVKQTVVDVRGNVAAQRFHTAGGQFGALAAALRESAPMDLVVIEPATLLRLPYTSVLELTKKHEAFRQNFSKLIAESVLNTLLKDRSQKQPALVGVFHQTSATRPITRKLVIRLRELDENPQVLSDHPDWEPIEDAPYFSLKGPEGYLPIEEVREKVKLWADTKRALIDVDSSIDDERASLIAEICDKIFWCVTPENWQASLPKLRSIVEKAPNWRDKINVIWLLPGDAPWAPLANEFEELAKRDFKLSFDEPPKNQSRELSNGLERIIHQLRGIRIGVALGGGAARGMAHLGVLKALEQAGICIDMIAGTSAGAMTGVFYASGMEPDYNAACFVKDLTPSWFFRMLPNGGYWYLLSKYRRRKFDPMLRKYLKDSRLQQLTIPVHSVTVDLISGTPVVREAGDSVHAITESINLPVLSVPINRNGRALIDGGIVNNIPADVLVANGCNFVIAVSVTAGMEQEFASNRPDTPTDKMKPASSIKTILRTYIVQHVNMNSVGVAPADFVIQPDVTGFDVTEFTRADEMATIGEETAIECLPELKELLTRFDDKLFAPSP